MITAFGYNFGEPRADKTFDVRDLTHATASEEFLGKQDEIVKYGRAHPRESIAIGCKAGRHRSVTLACGAAKALRQSLYLRDRSRT